MRTLEIQDSNKRRMKRRLGLPHRAQAQALWHHPDFALKTLSFARHQERYDRAKMSRRYKIMANCRLAFVLCRHWNWSSSELVWAIGPRDSGAERASGCSLSLLSSGQQWYGHVILVTLTIKGLMGQPVAGT